MPEADIFISHTHTDEPLANAIRDSIRTLFGEAARVNYSSNKELQGGIKPGQNWSTWIDDQVRDARVALILLTPASIQKPWVLWEAGAVAGAISARGSGDRNVLPITYRIGSTELPSPFGQLQVTNGLTKDEISRLFEELANLMLPPQKLGPFFKKLESACDAYLAAANIALKTAPLLVTEAALQELLERIRTLRQEGRFSETDELHDWLNIAFGREIGDKERPLDVRIHRNLGELYASANVREKAARQFELARHLSPRDIYVLRRLGKAYLDQLRYDAAKDVIETIDELDKKAFLRNAENAALKARWHSDQGQFAAAIDVLKPAIAENSNSYYLLELMGQAQLMENQTEEAKDTYKRILRLLAALGERNVWVSASRLTASLVAGDGAQQSTYADELSAHKPTAEQSKSICRGIEKIRSKVAIEPSILAKLNSVLGLQ